MVKTYRGSSNKLNLTARKQLFITMGTGSYYQRISILHVTCGNFSTSQIHHITGQQGQFFANIRYLIVNYYLHIWVQSYKIYLNYSLSFVSYHNFFVSLQNKLIRKRYVIYRKSK